MSIQFPSSPSTELEGITYEVLNHKLVTQQIDTICYEIRSLLEAIEKNHSLGKVSLTIDSVPKGEFQQLKSKFDQIGCLQNISDQLQIQQEISSQGSFKSCKSSIRKRFTDSISLHINPDKFIVLKRDEELQNNFLNELARQKMLQIKPQIDLENKCINMYFYENVNTIEIQQWAYDYLDQFYVAKFVPDPSQNELFFEYLSYLKREHECQYLDITPLKNYHNGRQRYEYLLYHKEKGKKYIEELNNIQSTVVENIIDCNLLQLMEGDFISYLEKWIGENCLSLIRNDNRKKYLIGPKQEQQEIINLIRHESKNYVVDVREFKIDQIPESHFKLLVYDIKEFAANFTRYGKKQSQYINEVQESNENELQNQYQAKDKNFQEKINIFYKHYNVLQIQKINLMIIHFVNGQQMENICTCPENQDSHYQSIHSINNKVRASKNQNVLTLGIICISPQIKKLLIDCFSKVIELDSLYNHDQAIIQFIMNPNNLNLLQNQQQIYKVEIQGINSNSVIFTGKRDNIEQCQAAILESIESGKQQVWYYDLGSMFHLSIMKKHFMEKILNLQKQFSSKITIADNYRITIEGPVKKIEKLKCELNLIQSQFEVNLFKKEIMFKKQNGKIKIDKKILQEIQNEYAVKINGNQGSNNIVIYNSFKLNNKIEFQIVIGSYINLFSSQNGQAHFNQTVMIIPVIIDEDLKKIELNRKDKQILSLKHKYQQEILKITKTGEKLFQIFKQIINFDECILYEKYEAKLPVVTEQQLNEEYTDDSLDFKEIVFKDDKKKLKSKKILQDQLRPTIQIYYTFYEDDNNPNNFYHFFDKYNLSRSLFQVFKDMKELQNYKIKKIILFLTDYNEEYLKGLEKILEFLSQDKLESLKFIELVVFTQKEVDQLSQFFQSFLVEKQNNSSNQTQNRFDIIQTQSHKKQNLNKHRFIIEGYQQKDIEDAIERIKNECEKSNQTYFDQISGLSDQMKQIEFKLYIQQLANQYQVDFKFVEGKIELNSSDLEGLKEMKDKILNFMGNQ